MYTLEEQPRRNKLKHVMLSDAAAEAPSLLGVVSGRRLAARRPRHIISAAGGPSGV